MTNLVSILLILEMWVAAIVAGVGLMHDMTPSIGWIVGLCCVMGEVACKRSLGVFMHELLELYVKHKTGYTMKDWLTLNFQCYEDCVEYDLEDKNKIVMYYNSLNRPYTIIRPRLQTQVALLECQCLDHDHEKCEKELYECLGPHRDFHGIPVTPHLLGHSCIKVTYMNLKDSVDFFATSTYVDDQVISLDFHEPLTS